MARRTAQFGLDGHKELAKAFRQLSETAAKTIAGKAVKAASMPVIDAAQRRAPVGPTGNLRASVQAVYRKYSNASVAIVGSNAPHAHLVEFGTGPRPASKDGKPRRVRFPDGSIRMVTTTGSMPANPWLHPAFDEARGAAEAAMAETVRSEIEREGARLA